MSALDIGVAADQLNAAWEKFGRRLVEFRVVASVEVPGHPDRLRWSRFGTEWCLTYGDDRSGIEIERSALSVRIAAAKVAGDLLEALRAAESDMLQDITAAEDALLELCDD